jgi:hypothetical protein
VPSQKRFHGREIDLKHRVALNIQYSSPKISEYYTNGAHSVSDVHPSEQCFFECVATERHRLGSKLAIDCAGGVCGLARAECFYVIAYFGINMNSKVFKVAKSQNNSYSVAARSLCGGDVILGIRVT